MAIRCHCGGSEALRNRGRVQCLARDPGRGLMLKPSLLLVGFAIAAPGTTSLYHQITRPAPVVLTCAEYSARRPSARWLRVRDCDVDYLAAGYREANGTILELFLPVRPAGTPPTTPAALVIATRDPAVLALAQTGIGNGRHLNQEQFLIMMLKIVTALRTSREIVGAPRAGFLDRLRTRRMLSGLTTPLAPGAVVVDLHAQPSLFTPGLRAAAGVALILTAVLLWRTGRRRTLEGASVATSDEPAVRTADSRFRGLLLLNLDPAAGPEHIEHAPPLGARIEIIRRIERAIPGMLFDARGRGRLRNGGDAVIVDVGREDPVSSAIAGTDGPGGVDALRNVLSETGWRAYAPRTGRFVDVAELQASTPEVGAAR